MGLDFPCGNELDKLSQKSSVRLPVCVSMDGAYFSMSGLQNKFEKYIKDGADISDGANFIFRSIASALSKSRAQLRKMYGEKPCIFAGGVMCNSVIRAYLSELENVYFAETSLSSDNACGTALLAYRRLLNAK